VFRTAGGGELPAVFITQTLVPDMPDIPNLPEPPDPGAPVLAISGSIPRLTADKAGKVSFQLRNSSSVSASGVTVSLAEGSGDLFLPTSIAGSVANAGNIASGTSRDVSLDVSVRKDAPDGYHEVALKLSFTSRNGIATVQTETIQVHISNPSLQPDRGPPILTVISSSLDKNTPGADGILKLTVGLRNTGEQTAANVRMTLSGFAGGLSLNESLPTKTVSASLAAAASSNVVYELRAGRDLNTGIHELTARIQFTLQDGTEQVVTETLFLNIIKSSVEPPILSIASTMLDKNMPGADGILKLTVGLRNTGGQTASNVQITLSGFSGGLSLNEGIPTKTVSASLAAGASANAAYELRAGQITDSGVYTLTALIRFRLPDGTDESVTETIYLNIIKPPAGVTGEQVQMSAMRQSTSVPGAANTLTVSLSFRNFGTEPVRNAALSFEGLSSSFFTLMGAFGDRRIGTIDPGQTVTMETLLHAAAELPNGNHQLKTVLSYTDAMNNAKTVETMIYIHINRPPSSATSVPRIIISQHSISEDIVNAGNPFELYFTLNNTSRSKSIRNMKVTVTDADGIFLPVAGVNSFYVEDLPINGNVALSIVLSSRQDAESKSYPVTISLAYEDTDGVQYAVAESLSIPVFQPQRLEITNINFFGNGMGGAMLSFQFINMGRSPLYNLNIKVEGPMALMEGDYFAGNFSAGSMDYFEDDLIMFAYGEVQGYLVLQFEDSAGSPQEFRQELLAWIDEPFFPDWGDDRYPPDWDGGWDDWGDDNGESGKILGLAPWLFWSLLALLIAAGGAVALLIIRKKRRAKALADDMADYDDE
jgi:hypothetical protein